MVEVHLVIPFKLELEGLQPVNQRTSKGRPIPWTRETTREATLIAYTVAGQVGDAIPPLEKGYTSLKIHEDTDGLSLKDQCDRIDDQSAHADVHFGPIEEFLLQSCRTVVDNGVRFLFVPIHWIRWIRAYEK